MLSDYPYFASNLVGLVIVATWLALARGQRLPTILSAALATVFAPFAQLFIPDYWNPALIWTWMGTSPEDVMFLFTACALLWMTVNALLPRKLSLHIQAAHVFQRFAAISAVGMSIHWGLWRWGMSGMIAHMVAMGVQFAILIALRPRLWMLSAIGSICGAIGWLVMLGAFFRMFPGFSEQWNWEKLWGVSILGVPGEEIVWACLLGAVWPLEVAYLFDAEYAPPKSAVDV